MEKDTTYKLMTDESKKRREGIGFLFDLDGVLIDSEREYTRIWSEINRIYPTGVNDFAKVIKGMTLVEIIDTYFPNPRIGKEIPELLYSLEGKMKYDWLPGAKELLEELKRHEIPAVLVTSSNDVKMAHLREELPELESFFSHIVTGDKVKKSKPDPEGYLLGALLMSVKPKNCVVFEDSLQGVKAGKAAGAYVIGVEGTLPAESLKPFSDHVTDSLLKISAESISEIIYNR